MNDSLCHYGVLGMRWGVRKGKRPAKSEDYKASRAKPRNAKYMSNEELRKRSERNELEARYKRSRENNSMAKKIVAGVLIAGSTELAKEAFKKYGGKALDSGLKCAKGALEGIGSMALGTVAGPKWDDLVFRRG